MINTDWLQDCRFNSINWMSSVFLLSLIQGCTIHSQQIDENLIADHESENSRIPIHIESAFIKEFQNSGVSVDVEQRLEAVADLDADDNPDYVITVQSASGTRLLMVHLSRKNIAQLISRNGGTEYPTPQKIEVIRSGANDSHSIQKPYGDSLLITKLESSSALIYWDGVNFVSVWQGD